MQLSSFPRPLLGRAAPKGSVPPEHGAGGRWVLGAGAGSAKQRWVLALGQCHHTRMGTAACHLREVQRVPCPHPALGLCLHLH